MNKIFLILVLSLALGFAYAQAPIGHGQTQLNIGAGFSTWGVPIYVGLDFGANNDFTLGAEFSYKSYSEKYNSHNYKHSIYGFSGNGNYHFNRIMNIPQDWDFYAGLNVGFYVWTSPDDYHGSNSSGLGLGGQIGGRYYFTDTVGVNLEFGGGNAFSGGKIGVSIKM
ncbi:MAG: hypothetical protein CVU50_01570 [Candidatus Cloacimonetes bacterium HGW-Cloacimonetes-3]|jgi:hypothetical protein|nr:MAG: hypothetical protein CVU50_01570 [Candidatus Cloacimonetes bacterium HGW-Cloacimonetes-3]